MRLRRVLLVAVYVPISAAAWFLSERFVSGQRSAQVSTMTTVSTFPPVRYRPDQPDLGRPLFRTEQVSADRGELATDPGANFDAKLLGVILTGERRIALLLRGDVAVRVEEGDELNGWKVSEIAVRRIRVENGEHQIEVLLDAAAETH